MRTWINWIFLASCWFMLLQVVVFNILFCILSSTDLWHYRQSIENRTKSHFTNNKEVQKWFKTRMLMEKCWFSHISFCPQCFCYVRGSASSLLKKNYTQIGWENWKVFFVSYFPFNIKCNNKNWMKNFSLMFMFFFPSLLHLDVNEKQAGDMPEIFPHLNFICCLLSFFFFCRSLENDVRQARARGEI